MTDELKKDVENSVNDLLQDVEDKIDAESYIDTVIEEDFEDQERYWPELKAYAREVLARV